MFEIAPNVAEKNDAILAFDDVDEADDDDEVEDAEVER